MEQILPHSFQKEPTIDVRLTASGIVRQGIAVV